MSDGHDKVAGADTSITLGGKDYRCSRIRYEHMAEGAQHVLKQRPDFLEAVSKSLAKVPDDMRQEVLDAAMRRFEKAPAPDPEEVKNFFNSLDGMKFMLWMMLRDHNPELKSASDIEPLIAGIETKILLEKIVQASGLADLKNSAGRAAVDASPALTTDPHESRGQQSISK